MWNNITAAPIITEIPSEAYVVLQKLAAKWTDILDARDLSLEQLKGAMTNKVYACQWERDNGNRPRKVLVRVYGGASDLFFNRADEVLTFERMSQKNQGPRLLGRFPNGRVEEFLRARTLTAVEMRDSKLSQAIAVKLLEFHQLDIPGTATIKLWDRLRDWLRKALILSPTEQSLEIGLNKMDLEIADLEKRLSRPGEKIGFCHNDLQYGNIMISEKDDSITIIDYEYASYNPVAFDIANHFCEMTADYHSDYPHILDFSKYPDMEEQQRFVKTYLEASGQEVTDREIESLMSEVEEYVLASHLQWALWGIMSAAFSEIDFNFMEYAQQRLAEYHRLKRVLFLL
ncbi:unnamed protein product [Sphagnum jensenii]|uniref:Choline kinase n=1 Tax=Sphagnum jensenii TaxID=128206 RepID=A0ABP0WA61_9BRYO